MSSNIITTSRNNLFKQKKTDNTIQYIMSEAYQIREGGRLSRSQSCCSTSSTASSNIDAAGIAAQVKEMHETPSAGKGFLSEGASFKNPLLKVDENTKVILLMYALIQYLFNIKYTVKSSFSGKNDSVLIEANIEYSTTTLLRYIISPFSFHLFHSVHLTEEETEDGTDWRCSKIEEVWDFNAISIGAHIITWPFVQLASLWCWISEVVVTALAVTKTLSA